MNNLDSASISSDDKIAVREKIDVSKLDEEGFATINEEEVQAQFAALDDLEAKWAANPSWADRIVRAEFKLNFKDKRNVVKLLAVFASFAGILSGLDQSIISGAQIGMRQHIPITDHEMSLVSSLMPLGAMAGSWMMVPLNHWFGRRGALIVSCLWYTLGGGLCAGARNRDYLYAGRFILGIGIGIEGGCVSVYISECVPPKLRGGMVSMYQFMLAFGEVLGFACCAAFFDVHGGWRYMLGSSLVFSTILLIGLYLLPESPRWLVSQGKIGEAWSVWKRLRDVHHGHSASIEFLEMRQVITREREEQSGESALTRYTELLTHPRSRRALIYAVIMVFFGQMTGVNGIMYNMSTMMKAIGFDDRKAVLMSMVGGGSLFLGTIPAVLFMDKFGRRAWAQTIFGNFIGLVFVGTGYQVYNTIDETAGLACYLVGVVLYMLFFGAYACLTWVVPAESFDLRTRAQGMAIASSVLYLFAFIVTYNFTRMMEAMMYIGLMIGFFGGIAFICFVYQILLMPETKNKTLEEIDDLFSMHTHQLVAVNMKRVRYRLAHGLRKGMP